jgi:hypothetical protein
MRKIAFCLWFLFLLALATGALAAPSGPDELNRVSSSRRAISPATSIQAQAGNVTELRINTSTITQGWQGYYGNVTGTIVLDDALNNSMYSWELADPEGEIFATRDNNGISWDASNIICANITTINAEETALNFNLGTGQDADGINETFRFATHPAFNVSAKGFNADTCGFTVSTYVNDGAGVRSFNETLLYSKSDASLIYAALIFPGGTYGFKTDSSMYDFQMLVAEDGHAGDASPTDYYFYVELS